MTNEQLDKLERLGQLHTQGIITDEQFLEQRAQILGENPPPSPPQQTPIINGHPQSNNQRSSVFGIIAVVIAIIIFFTPRFLLTIPIIGVVAFSIIGLVRDKNKIFSLLALLIGGIVIFALFSEAMQSNDYYTVEYEVTCLDCDVSYTNDTGGTDKVDKVAAYWSKRVVVRGDEFVMLSAQNNNEDTEVIARISVNGKLLEEESSKGKYVMASVSGRPEEINSK
ncbi:hypothetical protein GCM10027347_52620 [Larkinella harenae]